MLSIYRFFTCLILTVAVFVSTISARTIHLAPDGDDDAECATGAVFATMERAVQCLTPGDTLLIANGVYSGGVQVEIISTPTAPLVIRGESLDAVIQGSPDKVDAVRFWECSHVVLENLTLSKAGRAGVTVSFSDHVRISGCLITESSAWGIFTSFADDLTVENCETSHSQAQHGIYHSNSGDRFVIRRNHIHHNSGNGIHLNGDPEIAGGDGILNEGIVERNVIHHNGSSGGAALNMTHVHDVIVRNNLMHNNLAGGITAYQDSGTPEQSSKRVLIMGNTLFHAPGQGRSGVLVQTTTEQVVITGNIFVSGGSRGNLMIETEHLLSVLSDYNLFWNAPEAILVERGDNTLSLDQWRSLSSNDMHSKRADPLFDDIAGDDFMPTASSPAVDAAAPLDTVRAMVAALNNSDWLLTRLDSLENDDLNGNNRPAGDAADMGAIELGADPQSLYDFNGDGRLGVADALALLLKGLRAPQQQEYDINGDGSWGATDIIALLKLIIT
jgi:hypothetical protein